MLNTKFLPQTFGIWQNKTFKLVNRSLAKNTKFKHRYAVQIPVHIHTLILPKVRQRN